MARRLLIPGRLRMGGARPGEKYFAPTHAVRCYIGYAPRFTVWRCLMVGRMDIVGTRRGEKYFARTSVMRRRTAGVRSKRVGDSASIAHVGAKFFSPGHPWCGGKLGRAPRFGVRRCLMVGRWRMDGTRTGEKYFAPTHAARGYIGRAPRFGVRRLLIPR